MTKSLQAKKKYFIDPHRGILSYCLSSTGDESAVSAAEECWWGFSVLLKDTSAEQMLDNMEVQTWIFRLTAGLFSAGFSEHHFKLDYKLKCVIKFKLNSYVAIHLKASQTFEHIKY